MKQLDALEYWNAQGAEYFRELSTLGALPDAVILNLLTKGRVKTLEKGETLYAGGERSESFCIVLSGVVSSYQPRKDGGWALARNHHPGDDVGFVTMIALCDRIARVIAIEDSTILEISSGQFLDLHQQEPEAFGLIILNLVRGMARAFINTAWMLSDLNADLKTAFPSYLQSTDTEGNDSGPKIV
ncbi:cyclic nucleotide-binding domain-containing protein [Marinobacterium sp. YM272]|uniref:cyclic nucleotide-binding domain-containing protein n=1 Tax=Marinobacterium sp. YM272 TaxID=3421654 RepID=UPI003D7F6B29